MAGCRAIWAGVLAFGFAAASPAGAGQDIVPADPWRIIHVVRALTPAEVERDAFRDPMIRANAPGTKFGYEIVFHGCDFGRNCTTLLLAMRLHTPEGHRMATLANLAGWNRDKLVGRAARDAQGRATLEHAVVLGAGLPADTLSQTLSAWHAAMEEFSQFVEFKRK